VGREVNEVDSIKGVSLVYVLGPRNKKRIAELKAYGAMVIMTMSRSVVSWQRGLSPFYLGPVKLYGGHTARNVENAWQFCKVYKSHLGPDGNPSPEYFAWAKKGWGDTKAHRYPMGKGAVPEYSWWDGEKLEYVQARKKIYAPLYIKAVAGTDSWKRLKHEYEANSDIVLWDFDAYDHRAFSMTYKDVLNEQKRKMGHAFILAMLLECKDEVVGMLEG